MSRRVVPRSAQSHETVTANVLERHALVDRWTPALPVPIERIIEVTYNLRIVCEPIGDPVGETILGALQPTTHQIVLNERHLDLFESVVGPERFTLAHELGHWIYDADDPQQATLFSQSEATPAVFCRRVAQPGSDLREVNANRFASCLLLPAVLVRAAIRQPFPSWSTFATTAAGWGVSQRALSIRLESLGLQELLPG
jgi:Zn-dependent peptidase ImmA (M78 family)